MINDIYRISHWSADSEAWYLEIRVFTLSLNRDGKGRSMAIFGSPGFHQVYFMATYFMSVPCSETRLKGTRRYPTPDHAKRQRFLEFSPFSFPNSNLANPALERSRLVAGAAGLGDDALELVDLLLGTAESTELDIFVSFRRGEGAERRMGKAYPLLRELTGALVAAVAEELNDAALVGGEAVW